LYFSTYLKYVIGIAVLIVVQVSFIWVLAISRYNITPDFVILIVIFLGYMRGHIPGMIAGFAAGLVLDILSGSFIGLSALSYCLAGFIAGYFTKGTSSESPKKFSLIGVIFLCSLLAYTVFFMIYFQGSSLSVSEIFLKYIVTTTFYTSVFGLVFALFFNKFDLKKTF